MINPEELLIIQDILKFLRKRSEKIDMAIKANKKNNEALISLYGQKKELIYIYESLKWQTYKEE